MGAGLRPQTPALLVCNVSRTEEVHLVSSLAQLAVDIGHLPPAAPAVIIIGDVVAFAKSCISAKSHTAVAAL